jgi:hypothetical protein
MLSYTHAQLDIHLGHTVPQRDDLVRVLPHRQTEDAHIGQCQLDVSTVIDQQVLRLEAAV